MKHQKFASCMSVRLLPSFVLTIIIPEGLKGFLVAIGIDPHQD